MIPAVLIGLACGLPPVAASLHFAGGILPGLISFSAISIGCIVKSLHQFSYAVANVSIGVAHDHEVERNKCWGEDYKYEPEIDTERVEQAAPMAALIPVIATLAVVVVTFIAGGILPTVWSLLCALALTVLSIFSSVYFILPVTYTLVCKIVLHAGST